MKGPTISWRPKVAFAVTAGVALAIAGATLATVTPASGAAPAGAAVSNVAAAGPGSDATVERKVVTVEPGKVYDTTVTCPAGKRAVAGGEWQRGYHVPTFGYPQQSGPVGESGTFAGTRPGDVARGWSFSVFNNSGAGTREYEFFALCSANSDATIAANPFTVEPRTVNSASIDCPAGKRAVGGGVGQDGATTPLFGWIQGSGPVDATGTTANTESGDVAEGWFASVFNFGASTRDFHVYAICSADSDATIVAKSLLVAPGGVDPEADKGEVLCPAGKRLTGGGVGQLASTNSPRGYIQESGPEPRSIREGAAWYATVYNPPEAGAPTREFRVFAICASDASTAPTPTTTAPLPTTTAPPAKPSAFCSALRATIVGTAGNDILTGTEGRDVIAGLGGNDRISGLGGNDVICGGNGADRLLGGAGDDAIFGGAGNDYVSAGSGNDRVGGDAGNDRIYGGADNDSLYGGIGNDLLRGDAGNDSISGGDGNDLIYGGPGLDDLDGGAGQNRVRP